jgi:hypothetical protein
MEEFSMTTDTEGGQRVKYILRAKVLVHAIRA